MNLKFFSLLFFSILSLNALSSTLEWDDLDFNGRYLLNRELQLEDKMVLHKGDKLELIDRIGGEVPVIYMQFHILNCKNSNLESEIIIIGPPIGGAPQGRGAGVQLEKGCNLGIFIDPADYFSISLFDADN